MKRITSILVCLAFVGLSAIAQDIQITGNVTSADDGSALPGVSVVIKGTQTGVATNIDGDYSISASSDAVLVFTSIGMLEQEIAVGGQTVINAAMETQIAGLDEVIVVAYGASAREAITGSVTTVDAEQINGIPMTSVDKILQGSSPGMLVTSASGQPGSFADVRIRGIGSFSAGNSPLYVVDGVSISSGTLARAQNTDTRNSQNEHELSTVLSGLNPNDIESVTILKDAAATALYGTRASNGVVIITTKRGKEGKTQFNASAQYGLSSLATNNVTMTNSSEMIELTREGLYNFYLGQGQTELRAAQLATQETGIDSLNTDWKSLAFNNQAPTQTYNLSASGGNEKTKFFISGGMMDQEGIALSSWFKRFSGAVNVEHKANDFIKVGTNLKGSLANQGTPLTSSAYFISPVTGSFLYPSTAPAYNPDGTPYFDKTGPVGGASFIGTHEYNDSYSDAIKFIGNAYSEITIPRGMFDGLKYRVSISGDYNDLKEYAWDDPRNPGNTAEEKGRATRTLTNQFIGTFTQLLSYNKTIAENHNLNLMLGNEIQKGSFEALDAATLNFPHPDLRELGSGAENEDTWGATEAWSLLSYFGRLEYNYSSKYFLTSSLRRDGSSRFGANNRFATFYSVGASWNITREDFMLNIPAINSLKLRTSYGTTGNQEIYDADGAPAYYAHQGLYAYGNNYNSQPGSSPDQISNPDLKWEQTAALNVGIDFGLLKGNRISGSLDFYQTKTSDLLMYVPVSLTTGFVDALQNVGELENKGVELALSGIIVDKPVKWVLGFNISKNKNKILTLPDGADIIDGTKIRREGEAYQTFYMAEWAGVNTATGQPMWYDEDGNVVLNYTDADKQVVGTADPDFYGGLSNSIEYKGIDFSFMFYYQYGNKIYNNVSRITESDGAFSGWNQDSKQLERWQQPGDVSSNPKRIDGNPSSSNQMSTRWLEDGSYLRLKNVTLSYSLPSSILEKAKVGTLRIYAQATNLWTKTNYSGLDPEQAINGTSWFVYPNTKTITFGIDVGF